MLRNINHTSFSHLFFLFFFIVQKAPTHTHTHARSRKRKGKERKGVLWYGWSWAKRANEIFSNCPWILPLNVSRIDIFIRNRMPRRWRKEARGEERREKKEKNPFFIVWNCAEIFEFKNSGRCSMTGASEFTKQQQM